MHDVIKLHATYHGTIILLYNIAIILFEIGDGVEGIELEEVRRKTLDASDALVEIAALTKRWPNSAGHQRQIVLYVSFQTMSPERTLTMPSHSPSFTLLTQCECTSESSSDP